MHWVIFFLFHTFYLELVLLNEKFRKKEVISVFLGGCFVRILAELSAPAALAH